jgi:hypothetical protein
MTKKASQIAGASALVVALAGVFWSVFCHGQAFTSSFDFTPQDWQGPFGGGVSGGNGTGRLITTGQTDFVRSGTGALRLMVYDDGQSNAMAWSGISRTMACQPGQRIRAGVWLYYSSTVFPLLPDGATFQVRLEYFSDEDAHEINPHRVRISQPFGVIEGHPSDAWTLVETCDRVPAGSRAVKMSLVLSNDKPAGCRQAVWADDAYLDASGPRLRNQLPRNKLPGMLMARNEIPSSP